MPIISTDIDFFLSKVGGGAQSDPNDSFGGAISTTEVVDDTLHNVFDKVSGDEALAGKINYKALYVKNSHASLSLEDAKIWIESNTSLNDISIALAGEGINGTMERPTDEDTAPSGETFTQPANKAAGLTVGTLAFGDNHGFWEKRDIAAATPGENAASFQIKVEGDTQQ